MCTPLPIVVTIFVSALSVTLVLIALGVLLMTWNEFQSAKQRRKEKV